MRSLSAEFKSVLTVLLLLTVFASSSFASSSKGSALAELGIKLPREWKFKISSTLHNKVIKKYLKKSENFINYTEQLTIIYHFRTLNANPQDKMAKALEYQRLRCGGFSFKYDPGYGLEEEGAFAQYLCPANFKLKKGFIGLIAFIQGKKGLYELHWRWKGNKFKPKKHFDPENPRLTMPVTERELDVWYNFFNNITLKKVKRRKKRKSNTGDDAISVY